MITCRELGRLGRLGNMLFQVAGCIGVARMSGQNFAFPKLICHDMVERFGSTEDINLYNYLVNPLPEISVEEIDRMGFQRYPYFWEYRDINLPTGNWDMYAHFQSIKFFEHCIDEVRHYFTFKDEFSPVDAVALHIRCGDYINDPEAYHPVCGKEYYEKAVAIFPNERISVFSDDMEMAMKILPQDNSKFYFPRTEKSYIKDFKFMKAHKSFICANSSYSHFAALLGTHPEKKIVMPKKWFGSQAGGLNFETLYPPGAIVI